MIAKTRGKPGFVCSPWIDKAGAFAPGTPVVGAPGFDGMFVRAHREPHFVRENSIVAGETQAAAPVACPARVGNHFETFYAGGKLRFDNFDGGCLTVAQMEGRCGHAVFAGAGS